MGSSFGPFIINYFNGLHSLPYSTVHCFIGSDSTFSFACKVEGWHSALQEAPSAIHRAGRSAWATPRLMSPFRFSGVLKAVKVIRQL
jgi:hypothetical protein